jgi:hypothetical protein
MKGTNTMSVVMIIGVSFTFTAAMAALIHTERKIK